LTSKTLASSLPLPRRRKRRMRVRFHLPLGEGRTGNGGIPTGWRFGSLDAGA